MESWKDSAAYKNLMLIKDHDRVLINGERMPYRAICVSDRYVICTKPFNLRHTVQYFILDKEKGFRGPDNMVFCMGYETKEQCQERLNELENGETEVSVRRGLPIADCYMGTDEWVIE